MTLKLFKPALAIILSLCIFTTACTASWVSIALADLPVLVQMAINIATIVAQLTGQTISPADLQAIQVISTAATKDLNELEALYADYKANPTDTTLQEIELTVAQINTDLPALLQANHIVDTVLASRVEAGVSLILTTIASIAQLLPKTAQAAMHVDREVLARAPAAPLTPNALKAQWNSTVAPQFVIPCNIFCKIGKKL